MGTTEDIEIQLNDVGVKIDALSASIHRRFADAGRSASLRHQELIAKLDELQFHCNRLAMSNTEYIRTVPPVLPDSTADTAPKCT